MTSFNEFKSIVKSLGGPWATSKVKFSKTQSEYHAECNGEWVHLVAPGGHWSYYGMDVSKRMNW